MDTARACFADGCAPDDAELARNEQMAAAGAPPVNASSPADPAVRLLASSFAVTEQVVHAPRVALPVAELGARCAGKLDGVVLALLGNGNALVRALGALKAGLDIGECAAAELNKAQTAADHQAALAACVAHAGTPLGFVDNTLTCAVPPGKAP